MCVCEDQTNRLTVPFEPVSVVDLKWIIAGKIFHEELAYTCAARGLRERVERLSFASVGTLELLWFCVSRTIKSLSDD